MEKMSKIQNTWAGMHAGVTADPENRPDSDFYETPKIAVELLLERQVFRQHIWEPACGRGAIVKVLREHGHTVTATDLFPYKGMTGGNVDFLQIETLHEDDLDILTNPPFRLSLEFAQKGLELLKDTGNRLALLNRLAWLEGVKRKPFFESSPLEAVYVFSARLPMMHRPNWDGKKITRGTVAYAWFVWQDGYKGEPVIRWI